MSASLLHLGNVNDLREGEMKEIEVEGTGGKILLYRHKGTYRATSNKCTHYGAPLKNGVLTSDGHIVCPWHGACFSAETGDIEDGPALDSLIRYAVHLDGDRIMVEVSPEEVKANRRIPMCKMGQGPVEKGKAVVIVGGGSGGMVTADALREVGYNGSIRILSEEPHLPIDRIKLSKMLQVDVNKLILRSSDYLKDRFIDISTSTEVTKVDREAKVVHTRSGEKVPYDTLVLATGGKPRVLPIEGVKLGNVFTLRHAKDGNAIYKAITSVEGGAKVVVVGSSFIGMEVAATASAIEGTKVTVVGMETVPFARILGSKVGGAFQKLHESKGIQFQMEAALSHLEARTEASDQVGSVVLKSGQKFDADVVVLGVGVAPATDYLQGSGLDLEKDGSLRVDEHFKVQGTEDIYAVGDIATFPVPCKGDMTRIEHWAVAQNHGRAAANAIAGQPMAYEKIPFFWTAQHGINLRYAGSGIGYDNVIVQGDVEGLKFAAFYTKGEEVLAVATIGKDPVATKVAELLRLGQMPTASELKAGKDVLEVSDQN